MVFPVFGLGRSVFTSARIETVRCLVFHPVFVQHFELVISNDVVLLEGKESRSYRDIMVVLSRGSTTLGTTKHGWSDASRLADALSFLRHAAAKLREFLPCHRRRPSAR